MTDKEYTSMGENPGIALTTCTGCGASRGFSEGGALFCHNCGKPWAAADGTAAPPKRKRKWGAAKKRMARAIQQNSGALADALLLIAKDFDKEWLTPQAVELLRQAMGAASPPPRIAPDEVRELLTDCRRAVYAYWVLIDIEHPVNEVLTKLLSRIDAALAAASGDDGGTP